MELFSSRELIGSEKPNLFYISFQVSYTLPYEGFFIIF